MNNIEERVLEAEPIDDFDPEGQILDPEDVGLMEALFMEYQNGNIITYEEYSQKVEYLKWETNKLLENIQDNILLEDSPEKRNLARKQMELIYEVINIIDMEM